MKLPRLQNLYWYACALMGAGFLILGGMLIYHSATEFRRLSASEYQLERFASVIALANAASAERVPIISALRAQSKDQSEYLTQLQTLRQATDQTLLSVTDTLSDEILRDSALATLFQRFQLALFTSRQRTDQRIKLPYAIRQRTDLSPILDHLFTAADQAMQLRDSIAATLMEHDPNLSGDIILGIISSNLREYAGRAGFYVISLLEANHVEASSSRHQLIETKGKIESLGHLINNYGQAAQYNATLNTHIQSIQTQFFNEALPWTYQVALLAEPRLSSSEFLSHYIPALKPLEQLRSTIEQDTFKHIQHLRAKASQTLLIAGLITFGVFVIFFYLNYLLRFTLFLPLLTARRQIVALAHDDLSEPFSNPRHSSYELQQMFDGIVALRTSQKRKQALEHNQKKMAEQLRRLSETDSLTGLYNRRALELVAQTMIQPGEQQKQSIGLILFDIDHFKEINDTYGHAVGDEVLQKTSALLMPLMRPGDIFARFGGEEFIVLMPDTSEQKAHHLAEGLREALYNSLSVDTTSKRPVTASFGVAAATTDHCHWETLVALADQRMYFSKRRGRNQVTGANTRS